MSNICVYVVQFKWKCARFYSLGYNDLIVQPYRLNGDNYKPAVIIKTFDYNR